jgi:hypothetical protein
MDIFLAEFTISIAVICTCPFPTKRLQVITIATMFIYFAPKFINIHNSPNSLGEGLPSPREPILSAPSFAA